MTTLSKALQILSGSIATYVAMAACSAGGSPSGARTGPDVLNPVPSAGAQSTSGSRLKARYYSGADGSRQFLGWRDTKLGINCAFRWTTDNAYRCVPTVTGRPQTTAYATAEACFQGDEKKAIPAISIPCAIDENNRYVSDSLAAGAEGCSNGDVVLKVYKLGDAYEGDSYVKFGCESAPSVLLYRYTEVPLSEFVEATEGVDG